MIEDVLRVKWGECEMSSVRWCTTVVNFTKVSKNQFPVSTENFTKMNQARKAFQSQI